MTRASETTRKPASQSTSAAKDTAKISAGQPALETAVEQMHRDVLVWLDEAKAEEIVSIDIKEKSSIGDYMVVATGRSDRHVGAIADQVLQKLKEAGMTGVRIEGQQTCDWVVVDAGAIIVHVFRPEVREFYNIEKMWQAERPAEPTSH
ncbi:MAG: ribosome silencing factor [Hyphomicrobiaceae bacterium]|nr:ribosome silencing factor [Hyphomicrobiaceae bacterium]